MKEKLIHIVESLRKKGDYRYILSNYVDYNAWMDRIQKYFPNTSIENFTDFNYSTCFTMFINISNTDAKIGTESFTHFVKKNLYLDRIQIQVSVLAPYATFKYVRHVFENGEIKMCDSFKPFLEEHSSIGRLVFEFLNSSGLTILDKELLSVEIPNISLELKESNVTVYNCLFEDEY
ncbi:hypothetical protein ACJDU8_00940 [Clostridium sp. WILCCON 0269]|uniref:Uncharacterized protein n=1 Tax=Candidatus Clostridium eludens TaxID=3381663 RepID=A0ABW8SH16_9CLOT